MSYHEDQYYAKENTPAAIAEWKGRIDSGISLFSTTYGKPICIGEWGIDDGPPNVAGWQSVLYEQVKYLSGKVPIRQWHTWGYLYGEFYGDQYSFFTATESEVLLDIVYQGIAPPTSNLWWLFAIIGAAATYYIITR